MVIVGTRTLGSAIEDKAARFPDAPFLVFEDSRGGSASWTWRELEAPALT